MTNMFPRSMVSKRLSIVSPHPLLVLMQENAGLFSLTPERAAWRANMNSVLHANFMDHNDPEALAVHPGDVEAEMQSYEQDIALLRTIVQHMRYRSSALRRRPLPCELLRRIFNEYANQRGLSVVVPLSHVCRLWRQVALECPQFWTNIGLGRREVDFARVTEWANRAGDLPLDMSVRCSQNVDRQDLVPWLQERSNRIKSLSIWHMAPDAKNFLIPALPPLPNLTALCIIGLEGVVLDMNTIAEVISHSPALIKLIFSGVFGLQNPELLRGVADNVTELVIGGFSHVGHLHPPGLDCVLKIISACPSLEWVDCHALAEDPTMLKDVSVPQLLSLGVGWGSNACLILKYLNAPRLQKLRLICGVSMDQNSINVTNPIVVPNIQSYFLFLAQCLHALNNNCSPKIANILWLNTPVHVGEAMIQFSPYLPHIERLGCIHLEFLDLSPLVRLNNDCILEWGILSPGVRDPFPKLKTIMLTKCTMAPQGYPQAEDPKYITRKLHDNPPTV